MNYWRLLDCPEYEEINREIDRYISDLGIIETSKSFWNPIDAVGLIKCCKKFSAYLVEQRLLINSIAVTIGRSADCCSMHIDTPPARFKLSWPIRNTQDTYTRWFDARVETPATRTNNLGGILFEDPDQFQEIGRLETVRPAIIDAGVPHDVYIGPNAVFPRVGLQCQLIKEPLSL